MYSVWLSQVSQNFISFPHALVCKPSYFFSTSLLFRPGMCYHASNFEVQK